ncbi:MAG: CDP-diacylglycerol--serine O-phosphatidyltransferase [Ilumatobacteraceae bacterium]|nr:CDP-diacylglycerol--serine O-phosphatidyltransferase [Ilumatobacteraceae bacterium]
MTGRRPAAEASADLRAQRGGRRADDFRLISPAGVAVVRPDRLDARSRARAMLPSAFTLVNMLCGFTSIRASEAGHFDLAALLISVAIVFDIFDGAVARAVGAITPFGLQFDSLADLISFGVAPAILLWTWGLDELGLTGWLLACFWLACAAYRLGRFNVTIDPQGEKRYFIGLPSPGAAGVVLASVYAFDGDFTGWHRWGPVALAVIPAALMASSFRFTSFRWLASPRRDRIWVTVLAVVVLAVGMAAAPAPTLLVVAYGYVALCPLGWLTRPLRRRWFGDDAVAPHRTHLPSVFFLVDDRDDDAESG